MKGLYVSLLFVAFLFSSLFSIAQKRPVGYVSPSTLAQKRQAARPSYTEWEKTEQSLTLLNNEEKLIPVRDVLPGRIAALSIVPQAEYQLTKGKEANQFNSFLEYIGRYTPAHLELMSNDMSEASYDRLATRLERFPVIIVGLHSDSRLWATNYGVSPQALRFIQELAGKHQLLLAYFGDPQGLGNFEGYGPIIWAPEDSESARRLSPQLIFGALPARGRLPVQVGGVFQAGAGEATTTIQRLKYTLPEEMGLSANALAGIDALAREGLRRKAFPGAVVMAAKDNKVFYWKAFGNHDSHLGERRKPVKKTDVFDLASITKVAATSLATMKLQEEGKIKLDEQFSTYIPEAATTNKKDILIKELLTHQAGLIPFIRFWEDAMVTPGVFQKDSSASHPYRVAENLYIRKDYFEKVMWKEMLASSLNGRGRYIYSDVSMYFMRAVVERVTRERIDHFLSRTFYRPLGLSTMGFLPRYRLPLDRIIPTEYDDYFRMQQIWGDVHDEGAAMAGGISGHAGLFSNANDLMVVGQLLLNGGTYGGRRYLDSATIDLFNTRPYPGNRRGLGFDKANLDSSELIDAGASQETFGHTGFTGTCIWVDPETEIVYVFLSNRVYPSRNNQAFADMNIRYRIQKIIYDAFKK